MRTYVMVNVRKRDCAGYAEPSLVFLLEDDVGRRLVNPNAKSLQLRFDNSFVGQGFVHIKNDEDEMTGLCDRNDLSTSSFPVLGSLDDTW